jgi:RNA polymerase sigma-70 factor (family 1)
VQDQFTYQENELLRKIAEGDEQAFRLLFDTYNRRLFSFAEGLLKSAADAEEVVQEIFTRVWLNRASFSQVENAGQYLYQMVRNRVIDQIRKTARDKSLQQQVWLTMTISDDSLEQHLKKKETAELIEQALAQLPEQKQKIYRLSREKEYTQDQIASLTGLSRSRVNNILTEVLKHIRNRLNTQSPATAMIFWLSCWDSLF